MRLDIVRKVRIGACGVLLSACLCQTGWTAASGYWLRLDDLRMPRPKSEEAPPVVKPKPAIDVEPVPGVVPESAPQLAAPEESRLRISGSYKALAISSRTPDQASESYAQLIGRLRLKLSYRVSSALEAKIEHDTDLTTGNYLHTGYFQAQKNMPPPQYLSGGSSWLDRRDLYGAQKFFRAYVKLSSDVVDATLGRQRVALGTGRFWSTLDMLNPINPLQAERDEFIGVDALLAERSIGPLSKASMVYAPDPARRNDRWVAQYRTHLNESDITLTYGKYWTDHVSGIDFATQLGDVGIHGEAAYTRPQIGASYRKALLGFDYAFANSLSFSSELYYSDRSNADRIAQWTQNAQLALVQPSGGAYLGVAVGYEFTPLLKMSTYVLNNLKDNSRVLYPALTYSATDSTSLSGGAQFFSGKRDSEYGGASNLYFVRVQRFF